MSLQRPRGRADDDPSGREFRSGAAAGGTPAWAPPPVGLTRGGRVGSDADSTSGSGTPGVGRRARGSGRRAGAGRERGEGSEDPPKDPEAAARAICLRMLTGQPRTRAELAAALARRGIPDDAADAVLGRFTEVGLVDDKAFAEAWVGSRHAGRGLARRALAAELRRRGVDTTTVGEAVGLLAPETEERTARELVRRRLRSTGRVDQPARIRRLVGMLARKGYPPGLAARIVREELAAEGDDPGELDGFDDPGDPDGTI